MLSHGSFAAEYELRYRMFMRAGLPFPRSDARVAFAVDGQAARMQAYVLWPPFRPGGAIMADTRVLGTSLLSMAAMLAILCLPAVQGALGITPAWSIALIGTSAVWVTFSSLALPSRANRYAWAFHFHVAGDAVVLISVSVLIPAAGGDPSTTLWLVPVLYSAIDAVHEELPQSLGILGLHALAPLATIPRFLATTGSVHEAIASPLVASLFSGFAYHFLARRTMAHRAIRAEQEAALAALRAEAAQRDRTRLARDLHDSVGSALGVASLYGDLIERHADRPEELRRIAAALREVTHAGLGDLRGLLAAVDPASNDLATLAASLATLAERAARAAGSNATTTVTSGGGVELPGPVRLAVVRVAQEAVHNALRHARPGTVRVALGADEQVVAAEIADDGQGFDVAATSAGRGLASMRARAAELGGELAVDSHVGKGTRVTLTLPLRREAP